MSSDIDLHVHSVFSDGTDTPGEILRRASGMGLKALSITDHDAVDSQDDFLSAAGEHPLECVAGVEFSVLHHHDRRIGTIRDIDVIGYFYPVIPFQRKYPGIAAVCDRLKQARRLRVQDICRVFHASGVEVDGEDILRDIPPGGVVGKQDIARAVFVRNPDRFRSVQQVFDEFLGVGRPADVKMRFQVSMEEAIRLIRRAGGVAVVAHPWVSNGAARDERLGRKLLEAAFEMGVDGAEGYYPYHRNRPYNGISDDGNRRICENIVMLIRRHGGLVTCGSDYHGGNKPARLGEHGGDVSLFRALFEAIESRIGAV